MQEQLQLMGQQAQVAIVAPKQMDKHS